MSSAQHKQHVLLLLALKKDLKKKKKTNAEERTAQHWEPSLSFIPFVFNPVVSFVPPNSGLILSGAGRF